MSIHEICLQEIAVDALSSVTGGKVKPNAFAAVGSRARCAFVKDEIENRAKLIVDHATNGTIGGMKPDYARPIFSNGVIRSQLLFEKKLNCRGK